MDDQVSIHSKIPLLLFTMDLAIIPENFNVCILMDGSYSSLLISK